MLLVSWEQATSKADSKQDFYMPITGNAVTYRICGRKWRLFNPFYQKFERLSRIYNTLRYLKLYWCSHCYNNILWSAIIVSCYLSLSISI